MHRSSPEGHGRPAGAWRAWPWRTLPWLTLLIAAILLALPLLGDDGVATYLQLRRQRDDSRREVAALEAEVDSLAARLERLATEPAELERVAREQYNMRRPDEEVLLLVTPPPQP